MSKKLKVKTNLNRQDARKIGKHCYKFGSDFNLINAISEIQNMKVSQKLEFINIVIFKISTPLTKIIT